MIAVIRIPKKYYDILKIFNLLDKDIVVLNKGDFFYETADRALRYSKMFKKIHENSTRVLYVRIYKLTKHKLQDNNNIYFYAEKNIVPYEVIRFGLLYAGRSSNISKKTVLDDKVSNIAYKILNLNNNDHNRRL